MRFAASLVVLLATALPAAPSMADDAAAPLEKADRIEQEGRHLLESGRRAEGAKAMAQAWRIRAEVWGRPEKGPDDADVVEWKLRIERLKAQSNEAERAGHALKEAGKLDDARVKMDASGQLWREAKAIEAKLAARTQPKAPDPRPLETAIAWFRAELEAAEADVKKCETDGRETDARAALLRAESLRDRIRQLKESAAASARPATKTEAREGLEAEVRAMREQVAALREMIEQLKKRLDAQGR